jgi:ADP-ribosylglycohydrolase
LNRLRSTAQIVDRARGCIIGGVIGDALGGPFEGQPGPLRFREPAAWSISDDSQLTLATCESIIEQRRVSPEHIAQRFVDWYRARRISGMGASTLKALRDLDSGVHWALAGAKGEMAAGNGAAMRIAPLAFHTEQRQIIRDVCRITHHNEESYVGALAIIVAIRSLVFESSSPSQLLTNVLRALPDSRVRDRLVELDQLPNDLIIADVAIQFGSSGYVVDSVPLALYAARSIDRVPFDVLLRNVIEAGGDTDTIASMTGQIAGAWLGAPAISRNVLESLANADQIERVVDEFAATV